MKSFMFLILFIFFNNGFGLAASSSSSKTAGQPWPMPLHYSTSSAQQQVDPSSFQFNLVGEQCAILSENILRYHNLIFGSSSDQKKFVNAKRQQNQFSFVNSVNSLEIDVEKPCEDYPSYGMDESYSLSVQKGSPATLKSASVWGAIRGLETFSQLIHSSNFLINSTNIQDKPRFSHRGFLLDTSRHFLSLKSIFQTLDAMSYNKLNVFHWHIVDDQSFPYQSIQFPDLSDKGAYNPYTHVYSQADVSAVIEYARYRGIRVIPEFDSPGHSLSWGKSHPDLLTSCYSGGKPNGQFGPVDPTRNTTYEFLSVLTKELTRVFPDQYLHLGGDEVSFSCWQSNPTITAFMKAKGFYPNYAKLEEYYMQNLINIVSSYNSSYIIWQEVIDNGAKVSPDTVVEVWKSGQEAELSKVTSLGHRAILSSCWYLNHFTDPYGGGELKSYYLCDPQNFKGTTKQKELVIGGELCMWGEFVDSTNVIPRTWPRGALPAERLWSDASLTDFNAAAPRLEEQRCRMIRRGIAAQPVNGPGFCDDVYN